MSDTFASPLQGVKFPGIGIILTSLSCFTQCSQWVLVKLVPDISKQAILIYRGIYMAVFCVPIILYGNYSFFPKNLRQCLLICTRGIVGTTGVFFLYKSLDFLPLVDTTIFIKTEMIFTVILAYLILREKVHLIDVIAITLCMVGIILITRPSFMFEGWDNSLDKESRILGFLLATGCGFIGSFDNIIIQRINFLHSSVALFHHSVIQTLILYSYQRTVDETLLPECGTTPWIILGIGILSFCSQYFYINALYLENASCVALVKSLEILFSFIFQVTVTGENVSLLSVLGALFITLAVTIKACIQWYSENRECFLRAWNKIDLGFFRSRIAAYTEVSKQEL